MQVALETLLSYAAQHPRWFEGFTMRAPAAAHLTVYRELMPPDWNLRRRGFWLIAGPPSADLAPQGWKLHVSANSHNSVDILRKAIPVLRDADAWFKFLMDPDTVRESNGKNFPRGSSGKFITVYPADEDQFRRLAEELTAALDEFDGPYVLSDRRCPGSRVVFYRYGGFQSRSRLTPTGVRELLIETPDGDMVPDVRNPYWSAPSWAVDPYAGVAAAKNGGRDLCAGRFTVTGAISFSNRGGIYRGVDNETGADIVLREARPGVEVGPRGVDAVTLLQHEFEMMCKLADTDLFVKPVRYFQEWEHAFIAEEYVPGNHLGHLSIAHNPLYNLNLTAAGLMDFYDRFRALWLQVAEAIAVAHERGIVLGDLSPTNIMVTPEDRIRVIDLESAFREGVREGAALSTPGMVSRRVHATGTGDRHGDYYALGGILICTIFACHTADALDRGIVPRLVEQLAEDLRLPRELLTLIEDLRSEDTSAPDPALVRKRIAELPFGTAWTSWSPGAEVSDGARTELHDRLDATVHGVVDHLVANADVTRDDRLFPADLMVFETNPLSVAHGAYGCLYALHGLGVEIPGNLLGWALRQSVDADAMPPGLYYGTSGVAWVQSALGHPELAARTLRGTRRHPMLHVNADVLTGSAGYGMACLRMWRDTGLDEFRDDARAVGERLARTAVITADGAHWPAANARTPVGYGYGASGVAMFLLALHVADADPEMLTLGRAALEFDLRQTEVGAGGLLSFPAFVAESDQPSAVLRPYWEEGTAGIVSVLLRYHHVTGDDALRDRVHELLPDIRRKYAVFPQLFHGLSGIGNVLLDGYEFLGDRALLEQAESIASTVLCFAVERPEGIAFPGEQLVRESCDLATGSAGVALFLDRVRHVRVGGRTNWNFVLDDLLT